MRTWYGVVAVALALVGCKKDADVPARSPPAVAPTPVLPVTKEPTWYRAIVRAKDGVEVRFLLGIRGTGADTRVVYKIGRYELENPATFDGAHLAVPLPIHQTAVDATVGKDGSLAGTFSASWRAWGASSLELAATPVAAPTLGALETVPSDKPPLDFGEATATWRVVLPDTGTARLAISQQAPGDFDAVMTISTGNIVYLAGNGRGDQLTLTGFDGTAGYRIELALDAEHRTGHGKWTAGHRLDWRETVTATRGDFKLAVVGKATDPHAKVELPLVPELAHLEPGPLLVELTGSWCATCRYAAPVLRDLYREYHPKGMQFVSLLYEFTTDKAVNEAQAAEYRKLYGITWPLVPVPGMLQEYLDMFPTNISEISPMSFPTALFLAADGTLVGMHPGFPSPAAAEDQKRAIADYRALIERSLAASK